MGKKRTFYVEGELSGSAEARFQALVGLGFTNPRIVFGALEYVLSLPTEELIKVYGIEKALAPVAGGPSEGVKSA